MTQLMMMHGPRLYCDLETGRVLWTKIVLDTLIAFSYGAIFLSLAFIFMRMKMTRQLSSYRWVLASFAVFIVACAGTHLMDVISFWWPMIELSAAIRIVCAAASISTAILFSSNARSLSNGICDFADTLAATKIQRDAAQGALSASEAIATERKESALALSTLNAQLNAAIENTSEGVISIGRDWTLLYGNKSAIEMMPSFRLGKLTGTAFPT